MTIHVLIQCTKSKLISPENDLIWDKASSIKDWAGKWDKAVPKLPVKDMYTGRFFQENVSFIMLLQDRPKEEREARAKQLLEAVGLKGKEGQRPGQLSGGQQQRVAVARALASKPQFVLADEPTANLDSTSTANLLDIMEKLNKEEGMTFVFATHDDRVIKKARRIISIEDGKVLSDE